MYNLCSSLMEGIASRTGRPSSRYGSAPVFTGPVRRWQKQWINVSSSSSSVSYSHSNTSNTNGTNNNNNVSAIRVRRWTPVPTAPSGGEPESVAEERPRRKLRYAPIAVLDGKKREAEKGDANVKEASRRNQYPAQETSGNDDNALAAKYQASQKNEKATKDLNNQPMDLDADADADDDDDDDDDDDEDHDLGGVNKVADWAKAAQRGFAP